MARHLVEPATDMLVDYITANIQAALAAVRDDRNAVENLGIATPSFRESFVARGYTALQPPSLFVVCDDIDFKKELRGANFICATAHYTIAAISEGQTNEIVARATWRYQAALSQILDQTPLTNADGTFKITVIVRNADFSEEYDVSTQAGNPAKMWRKEVHLKCDVEMYEVLK